MEAVLKRLDALERQQREMDKSDSHAASEQLSNRVSALEERVEDLETHKRGPAERHELASRRTLAINNARKEVNAAEDEPWLFYCAKGTPTVRIQSQLDLTEGTAYELHARSIPTERHLWTELLRLMNPQDLPTKLSALQKLAAVQLSSSCHSELLIIVRGIPRAHEGLEALLPVIVTLAESVNIAWSEVENSNPDLLGRVALVLESEEEIKTLTVEKADTRTSLYVERL